MSFIFRRLPVALMAGALLIAPAAWAQDTARIGFVNTDRLLREAAPAKTAQAMLEQEFSKREKEIDDAGQALKNASDRFEREASANAEHVMSRPTTVGVQREQDEDDATP